MQLLIHCNTRDKMSSILESALPFLGPIGYGLEAYINTHLTANSSSGKDVQKLPGHEIKTAMQPFLDNMGIRKDLIVTEQINDGVGMSIGTNDFTSGEAGILIVPKFHETDMDACYWVMKHEIGHLKNNDGFTTPLRTAIATTVTAAAVFYFIGAYTLLLTIPIAQIFNNSFRNYSERRADNFAIAESSIEELKGGRRFLIASQQAHKEQRSSIFTRLMISPEGESRFKFAHPSDSSRIKKIENELKRRNIEVIDTEEEQEKIMKLKILFSNLIQKFLTENSHTDKTVDRPKTKVLARQRLLQDSITKKPGADSSINSLEASFKRLTMKQ